MARLILKSPYLQCDRNHPVSGYLQYIGTRERVELLPDDRPPTRKQEQLVRKLTKDFPEAKKLGEYLDYEAKPTKANASAFITRALEENWSAAQQSDSYMKYIATRPRAERLGDHGLFSDEDGVDLAKAIDELEHHTGNVWTHIISLKREDAARLSYDNILPPAMLEVLAEYKKGIFSDLVFPSRVKPGQPIDPGYVRKRLQVILKRAGCKSVRFHDLRHTFATMSLENGMDVKTLSTIIGHVSSATTLNTYTHITDEMRRKAAVNIDQGIAGVEVVTVGEEEKSICSEPEFTPVQPARRRPGTGYLKQIGENLWEGRYSPIWPDGKKHSRNVYGHTEAECEEKLAELILQMKAEIAALRSEASTEYPDGVSPKKKAIAAYLRKNPGVTNKAKIARDLNMDRTTVQRYYDEIRAEPMGEESLVPQT